LKYCKSHNV
jgi:hypothetical protein